MTDSEKLTKLRSATDDAIGVIESGVRPRGPVNWADLSCLEVAWVLPDDGEPYAHVVIEEAAPEATEFCQAIKEELERRGFSGVEVVTEWIKAQRQRPPASNSPRIAGIFFGNYIHEYSA